MPPPVQPLPDDFPSTAPPPPPPDLPRQAQTELTVKLGPGPGRRFPCSNCGASLEFVPGAQRLQCPYCGFTVEVPQELGQVREIPFEQFVRKGEVPDTVVTCVQSERRCDGCGAMVVVCSTVATDFCPFCGKHLHNPIQTPEPMMAPNGVLPFAVTEAEAKRAFTNWVSSRWFAPSTFRHLAELGRVQGVYIPFWTYDAMTWSFYTGQRGDYYWDTVGSGKNRRRVRKTRWRSVSGRIDHWFDDVLICASNSLPPKLVTNLEPWDLPHVQPFKDEFISGFRSERYQKSARDCYGEARVVMDAVIERLIRRDMGGDVQRIHSVSTQVDGVTFKQVLLPVWIAAYRYQGKTFRVIVNARTGELQGERPWSTIKIALAVFAALIAVAVVLFLLYGFGAFQ